MKSEISSGIIPLKQEKGKWFVFIIQNKNGGHFGFPKGKIEKGDTFQKNAERELNEETNLEVVRYLSKKSFLESYTLVRDGEKILKKVCYFAAEVNGRVELQKEEILEGKWLSLAEGMDLLTYSNTKKVFKECLAESL